MNKPEYKYEVLYRIDGEETPTTNHVNVDGDSIVDIMAKIKEIEKTNTIVSIRNLSLGFW
ncbi:hypothetical protein [Bacillus bombysepticus]|uniref:hypothetical protein n=1 Tax=Bacillus bombysepticus TaxID=658666 RepID=UPI00301A72D0